MSEWTLLKHLLDAVHQHSTLIGRIWLTVMAIFRLLVVAVAAEGVYEDERSMFVCDTLQPGCTNVCYDAFAPISQPRFWVLHIVAVSTPSLLFILYTWHNLAKALPPACDSENCSVTSYHHLEKSMLGHGADARLASRAGRSGVLSKAYVFHVCSRALLELAFLSLQWFLFGFRVPFQFFCGVSPCPGRVHCYISRPTEKSVFLVFMFGVGIFCVLLNLLELNHLAWKRIRRSAWAGRVQKGSSGHGGGFYGPMGVVETDDAGSLPTLDLLMGSRAKWVCPGGKCCSSSKGHTQESVNDKTERAHRGRPCPPQIQGPKQSGEVWI